VEFKPVHRMGIGHLLFVRPLHRTLDQFSHVTMFETMLHLALPITHPICVTEAGFPSGFTSSTGRNCTPLMLWENRVTVTNLVTPVALIDA